METPRHFCTYFDSHFLSRGLALHASLLRHCPSFHLWVLCLDEDTWQTLTSLSLPHLTPVALQTLETADPDLLAANPGVDLITYLDADLYFFANPEPLYLELGQGSVAIISHRFAPALKHLEDRGIYNVGWVTFRRTIEGLACLNDWRARCLEWCHDRVEPARFGDQKYLDVWPSRFSGVVVLQHAGANVAPWNLTSHVLSVSAGQILSNKEPLLFFHFHGLRHLTRRIVNPNVAYYGARISPIFREQVLTPYLEQLQAVAQTLAATTTRLTVGARVVPAKSVSRFHHLKRLLKASVGLMSRTMMIDPTAR